jgi:hypothetical protein
MNVTIGRYLLGIASLAIVCLSLGLAGVALRRRLLPDWAGAPARLAESIIALAVLIAILELLGAVGLFRLGPIVAACALAYVATAVAARGRAPARPVERRRPVALRDRGFLVAGVAVLAASVLGAVWASPMLDAYDAGIHAFDSLWYHLPWAASFAQTGRVTALHLDLEFLLGFYPATAELFHGLGLVLLGRDTLSPALNLLWLGPTLLAAWCIGRPRGRGPAATLGVAVVAATPMMDLSQPGSADGDIVGLFFLLAAAALVLNAEGRTAAYALGGLAAGFAISIKLTFLAPVLAVTVAVLLALPGGRRRAGGSAWVVALGLAGGFWYLRNLIAIGNPLPWSSFGGLLPTPAPPLQQHVTYAVAHYLTNSVFWKHFFVVGMSAQLGRWWYVIVVAAIAGPVLCLLPGADRTLRLLAVAALVSLAAYVVTPNSAIGPDGDPVGFTYNLRYAAPGLALALALAPRAPWLAGSRRQAILVLGLGAVLVATVAQASLWTHAAGAAAVGLVVLAGGLLLAGLRTGQRDQLRTGLRGRLRPGPLRALSGWAALALLVSLGFAGIAAGYPWQRHYLRGRYVYQPQISHLSGVWAFFRTVHHARVAVAGTYGEFFSYPLFGIDDSNRVQYIAQRGRHGSFTPITACRTWRAAVDRGHYRYLLATPGRDFWRPTQLQAAPERAWVVGDPAARLLLERQVTGQPVDLFELTGRLDAGGCRR